MSLRSRLVIFNIHICKHELLVSCIFYLCPCEPHLPFILIFISILGPIAKGMFRIVTHMYVCVYVGIAVLMIVDIRKICVKMRRNFFLTAAFCQF